MRKLAGNAPNNLARCSIYALFWLCFFHNITCRSLAAPIADCAFSTQAVYDESEAENARGVTHSVWRILRRVLFPFELAVMYELREYISDLPLPESRTRETDLQRLDEIYDHAVYLAEGDAKTALLASAWATLPYHRFPAVVPLLGWTVTVPVSTESVASYRRRLANLPGKLFLDSPPSLDRDKLPHFFGSAWMQCVFNAPELVDTAGEMIELFEAVFKLEGSRDPRDIIANRLGICFAMYLQSRLAVRPSDIFRTINNTHERTYRTRCR